MSRLGGTDSHFDTVIVGSGFGGSVMAYRLAEAGKRVCVLERGRAYPPGSFTRSPFRARESFWDPKRGLLGMYHYWSFKGIDALVSAGLGGGSLIYANVLQRKDERWFVTEDVNDGEPPVPGQKIEERIRNLHDRDRVTCQLCGECDVGCNFGAKNTLDYNYLTYAAHHGAEIRTLCDVRTIEPRPGGGYTVGYADLSDPDGAAERNGRPAPLRTITCDRLVPSAGPLGP